MIAWINFAVLLFASIGFLMAYVRSASPAGREMVIGPRAFPLAHRSRLLSGFFELVITINYVLYYFYPLPTPLPDRFPWPWWISLLAAALIGIPATTLMVIGARHAGEETLRPKKEHSMYGGIYTRIRHPQAAGEAFLYAVIAILLHSPFLTIYSLVFFPIFILLCWAEEQDLLLRYGQSYADYCQKTGAFWPKKKTNNPSQ